MYAHGVAPVGGGDPKDASQMLNDPEMMKVGQRPTSEVGIFGGEQTLCQKL